MKRWLVFLLCAFLLTGCSVTIDPAEEQQDDEYVPETFNAWQLMQQQLAEQKEEAAQQELEEKQQQAHNPEKPIPLIEHQEGEVLHYLALGDSLTQGVGDEEDHYGWTGRLSDALIPWPMISTVELDNRGKNGRRSDQLLKLLEKGHYDKELAQADLLSISIGGNDVMKVVKKDLFGLSSTVPFKEELLAYRERYIDILAYIREHNPTAPLIILGFYNPFTLITDEQTDFHALMEDWNNVMETMALTDVNACYIPIDDLFLTNDDLVYHTDFFHPNAEGYNNMTTRVIETLQGCDIEQMSDGSIGFERMTLRE